MAHEKSTVMGIVAAFVSVSSGMVIVLVKRCDTLCTMCLGFLLALSDKGVFRVMGVSEDRNQGPRKKKGSTLRFSLCNIWGCNYRALTPKTAQNSSPMARLGQSQTSPSPA